MRTRRFLPSSSIEINGIFQSSARAQVFHTQTLTSVLKSGSQTKQALAFSEFEK